MNQLSNPEAGRRPVVFEKDGRACADSRDVAAYFGKEHKRVLQTIRELKCSDEFRRHSFVPFKNKDLTGEFTSHVMMTKDGFAFLVMGFTGTKAAQHKEAYIAQFNAMEAELANRGAPQFDVPKTFPQALRLALEQAEQLEEQQLAIADMRPKVELTKTPLLKTGSVLVLRSRPSHIQL